MLVRDVPPLHSQILQGKKIVLGVTGGIAIIKACEWARMLTRAGAVVHTVLTLSAQKMVAPEVFSALTGEKAWCDQWQDDGAGMMAHIALSRGADAIIIVPATANTIAKLSHGIADDLLSTLVLGRLSSCPLLIAPAMNVAMWDHPQTQKNLVTLNSQGVTIFPPESGMLACGEEGSGRLMPLEDLMWHTLRALTLSRGLDVLKDKRVAITLGPTLEKIDPVRGITNISSGAMGVALAQAAWVMGAHVDVVAGGNVPSFLQNEDARLMWRSVESAQEMSMAVESMVQVPLDGFFAVAAVADYRVENSATQKIKKTESSLKLSLCKNPDILKTVSLMKEGRPKLVLGFAAESEKVVDYARQKLIEKQLDFIVANNVAHAFGKSTNSGYLISAKQSDAPLVLLPQSKALMAWQILQTIFNH